MYYLLGMIYGDTKISTFFSQKTSSLHVTADLLKFSKYKLLIEVNVYTVLRISSPFLSLTHFPML